MTTKTLNLVFFLGLFGVIALFALNSSVFTNDYSNPARLFELVKKQNEPYLIIDLRYNVQYNKGHIPTAVNIPIHDLEKSSLSIDKNHQIILYGKSDFETEQAKQLLEAQGYTDVIDFGGFIRWDYEIVY